MSTLLLARSSVRKSLIVFDKSVKFLGLIQDLSTYYNIDVGETRRVAETRTSFTIMNMKNWQKKRFCVDLSYLLCLYGQKPLIYVCKNINPTAFILNLTKDIKIHKSSLKINPNKNSVDFEKLKNSGDCTKLEVKNEEIIKTFETLEKCKEKIIENDDGNRRSIVNRRVDSVVSKEKNLMKRMKPEIIKSSTYLESNERFIKSALGNKNIVEDKSEENINIKREKLTFKDILLHYPLKVKVDQRVTETTELFEESKKGFLGSVKNAAEYSVCSKMVSIVNNDLNKTKRSISDLKSKAGKSYTEDERKVKNYLKERKGALTALKKELDDEGSEITHRTESSRFFKYFSNLGEQIRKREENNSYKVLSTEYMDELDGPLKGYLLDPVVGNEVSNLRGKIKYKFKGELCNVRKGIEISKEVKQKKIPKNQRKKNERILKKSKALARLGIEKSDISLLKKTFEKLNKAKRVFVKEQKPITINYWFGSNKKVVRNFLKYMTLEEIGLSDYDRRMIESPEEYDILGEVEIRVQRIIARRRTYKIMEELD